MAKRPSQPSQHKTDPPVPAPPAPPSRAQPISPSSISPPSLPPTKGRARTEKNEGSYRDKYKVMHVGVGLPGQLRYKLYEQLMALAKERGLADESTIVWEAIRRFVENPPPVEEPIQRIGQRAAGSAPGFWVVPLYEGELGYDTPQEERAVRDFLVIEVFSRNDILERTHDHLPGMLFERYNMEDIKSRARALRKAIGLCQGQRILLLGNVRVKDTPMPRPELLSNDDEEEQEDHQE
jgi:hypothetical protein